MCGIGNWSKFPRTKISQSMTSTEGTVKRMAMAINSQRTTFHFGWFSCMPAFYPPAAGGYTTGMDPNRYWATPPGWGCLRRRQFISRSHDGN